MTATALAHKDRAELQERIVWNARRNILHFAPVLMPGYQVGPHHGKIGGALHAVLTGRIKRLMISMPPRHGKSKLVSQLFPNFAFGHRPTLEIIQIGYSIDISMEHSRKARDYCASPQMHTIFPHVQHIPGREGQRSIPIDRQAAHEWGTASGGRYYAVGVGGGITGRGADIAIIDDPVKDRQEADSLVVRNRVYDWYRSTLYTRLSPSGAIILVMTRWHEDDLAGRLLREAKSDGEQWYVLNMPAIDDAEQALWPARWPVEKLEAIKRAVGPREWEALYQGRPAPKGGTIFQRGWWDGKNRYDITAPGVNNSCVARVLSWDTAEETGETNAYTCCTEGELSSDYKAHIRNVWRDRLEFPELVREVIRKAEAANRDKKLSAVIIENKSSGIPLIQTLHSTGPEWLRKLIVPVNPTKSKELRAMDASVWCDNGAVILPFPSTTAPWLYELEQELFSFPASTFKDMVDSFTQLVWYWEHYLAEGCKAIRIK
jgi:predicted phage terminase large subunit-like protein